MKTYAESTTVSVERTRAEIEGLLMRYGAERFAYATEPGKAQLIFSIKGDHGGPVLVRMTLPLPSKTEKRFTHGKPRSKYSSFEPENTVEKQRSLWEQACRSRWRSLFLVVKAKLDAVTVGISTIEREFLADTVLPNGQTMGEHALPKLAEAYERGGMPRLLLLGPANGVSSKEGVDHDCG